MEQRKNMLQRSSIFLLIWFLTWSIVFALHGWQASMEEDARWIDSCHTMGDRKCGPGSPWHGVTIHIGGND